MGLEGRKRRSTNQNMWRNTTWHDDETGEDVDPQSKKSDTTITSSGVKNMKWNSNLENNWGSLHVKGVSMAHRWVLM